jgi:hypothetical protein
MESRRVGCQKLKNTVLKLRSLFVVGAKDDALGNVSKGLFRHCERSEAIRKYLIITGLLRRSSYQ